MESDKSSEIVAAHGTLYDRKITRKLGKNKKGVKLHKPHCGNSYRVQLCWQQDTKSKNISKDSQDSSNSYTINNDKEKLILWHAENFRLKIHSIYPNRAPLLLAAKNECGIQKLVCTFLRPTSVPYPEFGDWRGIAKFLADHLTLNPLLEAPTQLPAAVRSAREILRQAAQADRGGGGHCLELACVLGCILLGAGYNALVVSGYASRRLCLHEQTREPCPYLKPAPPSPFLPQQPPSSAAWSNHHQGDVWSEDGQNGTTVYRVQPRKTFESQYLKTMDEQAQQKLQKELERQGEARRQKLEEEERLPPDELHGRRVHCWILVFPGGYRNDVEKPFYLEPASGNAFDLEDPSHMGVESVWNHQNYWFYTQSNSTKPLEYDLTDRNSWIPLIDEDADKNLDMPDSWMDRIIISGEAYQTRYPGGSKTILYKRSKLELFAKLSRPDGLTVRVTQFSDLEWTDALQETSVFKHRQDSLLTSLVDLQLQKVTDIYGEGRADHVKEHEYFLNGNEERRIHFYNASHPEGLTLWQVQPKCVIEQYCGHSEKLCRREMWFTNVDGPVEITIEEFLREENTPGATQKQIAKRKFFHLENKIFLKYHHAPDQITAGYLHFLKPVEDSKFGVEHIHEYEPYNPDGKKYNEKDTKILIKNQLDAEEKNVNHAGQIYSKIHNLLVRLKRDRESPGLNSSIFDEQRNQELVHLMEKQEQEQREHSLKELMDPIDLLAPLLERKGNTEYVTPQELNQLKEECEAEIKNYSTTMKGFLLNELAKLQQNQSTSPEEQAATERKIQALQYRLKRLSKN